MGELIRPGWVWMGNRQKPFFIFREIKRGKKQGKYEVQIKVLGGAKTDYKWKLLSKVVDRSAIVNFPERTESGAKECQEQAYQKT